MSSNSTWSRPGPGSTLVERVRGALLTHGQRSRATRRVPQPHETVRVQQSPLV